MENNEQSRRRFLSKMALGAAGSIGAANFLAGYTTGAKAQNNDPETQLYAKHTAPDGPLLRAGVVGCGGRGTGAAVNFLDAGPNLEIVALGDVFADQLEKCRDTLKQSRGVEVADEHCFTGFDCYQKVIDADVDVVLLATPPYFRAKHVKAAIDAGKHVFQEKPVAVDPVGARLMEDVAQQAKAKNLCMVSGTIRRYQKDYAETQRRVRNGAIGEVIGANILRNGGALWWIERKPEWSDMEYMLRNWGNFAWLSGDHIVEMFIHELDVMSWYVGDHPEKAVGYGSRMQRISGDQFDQFSISYEYPNGKRVHCATRQINGCANGRKEIIIGTKGYADASGKIYDHNNTLLWEYPHPAEGAEDETWVVNNPFVQEHVELITAIRTGETINDSDEQIKSCRIAMMGRMAAYTGQEITWEQVLSSNLKLGPEKMEFGPVPEMNEKPPVVGAPPASVARYG